MQTVQEQCSTALEDKELEYQKPQPKPVYDFFKRFFDIILSVFALIVLSPLFLVVAILIKAEDGGNVFFSQTRLTQNGKKFEMYKFRSMCPDAEEKLAQLLKENEVDGPAFKMTDDPRVTKIGKFIRRTSIDELPQLINILKGDMTIIGPRPPLIREVEQYTPYQMHRLDVKTGLACYHECYGRSNCKDFDEWVEQDLRYIRERSLWTDFKIILMTIRVVLTGHGAV